MTSGAPAPDALTVELTRPRTDTVLVRVHGTLDRATAPVLDRALQRRGATAPPRHLVLDLSDVAFVDSPGVTVLVRARRRTETVAGTDPPCLVGLSDAGTRMLRLVGVRDLFDVHDTLEAALTPEGTTR